MTQSESLAPAEGAETTRRGARTRNLILETALELFRERGFEDTTMRAIATRAGVAVGNAYYYFKSKDHLIQAFYGRTHDQHLRACQPILAEERELSTRLRAVMRLKLDTIEPYHRFAGVLFRTAGDPASPLHPFSDASSEVRRDATELFREVLEGSDTKLPDDLRSELPNLLWLYQMGVILFWIHDRSEGCARSYRLVESTTALITRLIGLARLPLMGSLRRTTLALMADLRKP